MPDVTAKKPKDVVIPTGVVAAPMTVPFSGPERRIDWSAIDHNVGVWAQSALDALVLGTATGEESALVQSELIDLIRFVRARWPTEKLLTGGVDTRSAASALKTIETFESAGADAARVRTPTGWDGSTLLEFYSKVAENTPLPLFVIHQTFDRGPAGSPEILAEICEAEAVLGYVMGPDLRFESVCVPRIPSSKRIWVGNGRLITFGMLVGADGAQMLSGLYAPELCKRLVKAGLERGWELSWRLQVQLNEIEALVMKYGIGGVKAALDMLGMQGGSTRLPSRQIPETDRSRLRDAIARTPLGVG